MMIETWIRRARLMIGFGVGREDIIAALIESGAAAHEARNAYVAARLLG